MSHNITVESGTSVRLPTAGKYCDRDIVVKATGGSIWDQEIPNDGKTRIFIHLEDGRTSPLFRCKGFGTVTVDWGDGTEPDNITGSGTDTAALMTSPIHEYAEPGDYIITLNVDSYIYFYGDMANGSSILGAAEAVSNVDTAYRNSIKKVIIGNDVDLKTYALANMNGLASIIIREGLSVLEGRCCFYNYGLVNITLPASLVSIKSECFYACFGTRYYDFTACSSVPTLLNVNSFSGTPEDCEIRVPAALYDEWIAATNWASISGNIVVPQGGSK